MTKFPRGSSTRWNSSSATSRPLRLRNQGQCRYWRQFSCVGRAISAGRNLFSQPHFHPGVTMDTGGFERQIKTQVVLSNQGFIPRPIAAPARPTEAMIVYQTISLGQNGWSTARKNMKSIGDQRIRPSIVAGPVRNTVQIPKLPNAKPTTNGARKEY